MLDTTKRPNSRPGQGEATLRGQTIFFQYRFLFFNFFSNIKSFTGTKYIWTTSCRNWKACVCLLSTLFFPNPTQNQNKDFFHSTERQQLSVIQITSSCTNFGFSSRQDKTSINLLVEREQCPIDYQTRKIRFPSPPRPFLELVSIMEQDNIYRDAKLPHCQRKEALQNVNRQNREMWLLELFEQDFVMEAPEVSQVPFGTTVDCTLCFFFFLKEIKKKKGKKSQ